MRKDKVVAFRMNDNDEQCLNECFKMFGRFVPPEATNTFTKKMLFLIHNIHDELAAKSRAIDLKDKQIMTLNDKLKELNGKLDQGSKDKKKIAKTTPITIPKPFKGPKSKLPNIEYVECPSIQKKVMKVQCDFCKAKDWDKWKACQEFKREQ